MSNGNLVKPLSLFAITWPIFIESALQMFLRTADTFMLSRISDDAVAAVGISNQLIMFAIFLFNFVAVGSAVVVTQYLGAQQREHIGKLTATSLAINLLFGLLISVLMLLFRKPLLQLFGLEEHLLSLAQTYLFITGGALFVQAVMITVSSIVQAHGFTRDTMMVTIGMNVFHVALNYVLIYGVLGFPKLGVTGAAISTVVSTILGLTANILILLKRVRVEVVWSHTLRWKREYVSKVLKVGVPSSGSQLSYSANQLVVTAMIASLGAELLTTRIYTQNIMFFIMILAISLGRGMQIIVGHLIGAGEKEEAYRQVIKNLARSMAMTLAAVSVVCLFREPLLRLFTSDPDIVKTGAALLLLGFLLEPGRNFNILLERCLQATGDARYSMLVSVSVIWLFSVPLTYLLGIHFGFGLFGIWAAFIVDEWVRGLFLFMRWRSRAWERKALVQRHGSNAAAAR
ncbi:MATE family efflux transporter [Paenibacillus thermotolerans]|uniref:MATE family efflux transporter n=1 Tax=Paenibacillus thermotolerans TaxID=3027807 RepID=UPI002368AB20|nr:MULTISPECIES: MATE family efflux transporter [unclassified Paenibacillus]